MTPRSLILAAVSYYRREPARVNAAAATLLGPLLVRVGLGVDSGTTLALVAAGLNLAAGELTRRLVTPTAKIDALVAKAPEWDDGAGFLPPRTYAEGGTFTGTLPIVVGEHGPDQTRFPRDASVKAKGDA